jgi:Tol biopolymer transport system component
MPAAVTPNALDKNLLTSTPETMSPGLPIMTETPLPTNIPSLQTDVAATPFGSGSGKISFVTNRTGIFQIWLMDADGKNQRQLTSLRAGACQPDWSPDGSRLVVISPCSGKNYLYLDTKIYILNADGSNPIPVPITQEGDFSPVWSPEGERIAFTSLRSGVSHIFIYNLTDKTLSEISDTRFADMMPAWNPTGKQLAIVRKNLYNHIWMISDTGQTQFQFSSSGNVNDLWPVWSSDGEFLLYSRNPETASIPYLLKYNYEDRTTGAEVRIPPISSGFGPVAKASLSYDKTWIAFESWPDGNNHDIYRMDLDGNDITRLTTDPGIDFYPVWQPEMTFQE